MNPFASIALSLCFVAANAQIETLLEDFHEPEDLLDIVDGPWILVSELSLERDIAGQLSMLQTETLQKFEFEELMESSEKSKFADPTCISRSFDSLAPHGLDGINKGDGTWEIAVVNHFDHESIEFYKLNITNVTMPTLTSMGCVRLVNGDIHNDVSFNDDYSELVVTLWFRWYYSLWGFIRFTSSFRRVRPGGDGSLIKITEGGEINTFVEDLNGPNGVTHVGNKILAALNSASEILIVDENDPDSATVLPNTEEIPFPDNLVKDSPTSFLVTGITSRFNMLALCDGFGGSFCNLESAVFRYDLSTNTTTELYSSEMLGQPTVALIKDNIMYLGIIRTNSLLIIEGL